MSLLDQFRFIAPKCPKRKGGHSRSRNSSVGTLSEVLREAAEHAHASGKEHDGKDGGSATAAATRVWVWGCQNALLTIKSAVSTPATR
ncbi:hypothetical protein ElyMa_005231200 [Elysia marginata]|uniref:Uncharacterized protein n=1 Tax=Elysia marginata TaxID=1093978 RepID=A0AAV4JVW6_9GAST|nr:hypothetical protein ElyMa_005231200 [Elysia marginata]